MDRYTATIETDPAVALACWRAWIAQGAATSLFQTPEWLAAWYATLGAQPGRQLLFANITRRVDGRLMLALPLLLHRQGGLRRIDFADLGVTDYTAPLLAADCPEQAEEAKAMFQALRRVLPRADLLAIQKMPETVAGRANPLVHLHGVRASQLFGNPVTVGEDFDVWRYSREKTHRKELERSWRVFTRHPEAAFRLIESVPEATRVMEALEAYQRSSIANKGWAYILDEPGYRDFYRQLIDRGLASGDVVLSALTVGDEVIGALLGIRRDTHYAMIRIGNAVGEWRNCSPGRLVIERTMAALHERGVRHFDFTIGDYTYKKGFLPEHLPLYQVSMALSWKAMPHIAFARLKHELKKWRSAKSADRSPVKTKE